MAKKSVDLMVATHPEWVNAIIDNFDSFLQDHANCERKASALAMSMVVKYPDRTKIVPRLIALAREELEHFQQVYQLMVSRELLLLKDRRDEAKPYFTKAFAELSQDPWLQANEAERLARLQQLAEV